MKISVIIPVFNASAYLKRCLDSVITQTHHDLEILLIDDGSTDNSLQICYGYQSLDSRIVIRSQENNGVSSARNVGLEIATGEFIAFVDADDFIDSAMYESLAHSICSETDVVLSGMINEYKGVSIPRELPVLLKDNYAYSDIKANLIPFFLHFGKTIGSRPLMGTVCSSLFRRDVLQKNQIMFSTELKYCEDLSFCFDMFLVARIIRINRHCFYHYQRNINTSTERYMKTLERDVEALLKKINELHLLEGASSDFEGLLTIRYSFFMQMVRNIIRKRSGLLECYRDIKSLFLKQGFQGITNNAQYASVIGADRALFFLIKFRCAFFLTIAFKVRALINKPINP